MSAPMPRPTRLIELWESQGGPTPDSLPLWWDHYSQSRTFFLVGFWDIAARFGVTRRTDLKPFVDRAIILCQQDWSRQLTYPKGAGNFWSNFNNTQLKAAVETAPMCLAKIGIAVTALELLAASSKETVDVYNHIYIAIAAFKIEGLTTEYYRLLVENYKDKLEEYSRKITPLVAPKRVAPLLQDIVRQGNHVTYEVAVAICDTLSTSKVKLTPELARRNRQQGMSPASSLLRFVPKPL